MSDCSLPDDPDELRYRLHALDRQIPELRKRTWPGEDAPEVTRLISERKQIQDLLELYPGGPTPEEAAAVAELLTRVRATYRVCAVMGWVDRKNGTLWRYRLEQRIEELDAKLRTLVAAVPPAPPPPPVQSGIPTQPLSEGRPPADIPLPDDPALLQSELQSVNVYLRQWWYVQNDPYFRSVDCAPVALPDRDGLLVLKERIEAKLAALEAKGQGAKAKPEPGEEMGTPAPTAEKPGKPPDSTDAIDELAIANALAAKGHTLEDTFVRGFKNVTVRTWQEIVEAICPGEERDWKTVKTWVNRVKNALLDLDPPCPLSFSTSQREHIVIKEKHPE
jgi:hypothetical protein